MSEKTEWRECSFAGDGVRNVTMARMCRVAAKEKRLPGRVLWDEERMVNPEACAACPVPALVAALRAVAYILESRDKPTGHGPAADAAVRRSDEHIGAFIRKNADIFTKALALLPKGG